MHAYLQESEYAVRGLFDLIGTEQIQCEDKLVEIQVKTLEYRRAKNILNAGAPMSGFGENTTPYFEKKAQTARRQVRLLEFEVASLKASVETKEFSISSIAGAILQIAKQGMSIVHGSFVKCPSGRYVGRETLKNVIWQGRNQSIHWEEGRFSEPVTACFTQLKLDFGERFNLDHIPAKNCAKDILDVLNWKAYLNFETDMQQLIQ